MSELRCPYQPLGGREGSVSDDIVMSNDDREINRELEMIARKEDVAVGYSGRNFFGWIWFCREKQEFHCEVMYYGVTVKTVTADTLEEIRDLVCDEFGRE